MKIGIIDDQEIWIQRLEEDISDLLKKEDKSFQIQSMTKGQTLLDEYRDGNSFDLLFIDIEMDGMDGIQLGDQIRKLWDKRVKMVYISAYPEKVYKAINYDLLGFIGKASYRKEDLDLVLKRTIKKLEKPIIYYYFHQDRKKRSIELEKILYFRKKGRKVEIRVFDQGQYQSLYISSNLKEATKDLKDDFLQIRQDVVIQRFYGKDLGAYQVQMDDGETFEVGRNFRKDFWGVGK